MLAWCSFYSDTAPSGNTSAPGRPEHARAATTPHSGHGSGNSASSRCSSFRSRGGSAGSWRNAASAAPPSKSERLHRRRATDGACVGALSRHRDRRMDSSTGVVPTATAPCAVTRKSLRDRDFYNPVETLRQGHCFPGARPFPRPHPHRPPDRLPARDDRTDFLGAQGDPVECHPSGGEQRSGTFAEAPQKAASDGPAKSKPDPRHR